MASLVTTPAAMEKDSGLGTLAPSLWVGIEENPHGEGETDDEMIIPPEYALDLSQYDLKSMRASAMKKPFMGPSSQNATRTGWDANCNPRSEVTFLRIPSSVLPCSCCHVRVGAVCITRFMGL